ncbi:MAG: S1C family serine protease [Vicinamibacterales bacterium]
MTSSSSLSAFSNHLADAVARVEPAVVQVHGRRLPASGVAFAPDAVVTAARGLRRDQGLRVRAADGRTLDAEIAGWDPATHLAVLRVPDLGATPAGVAAAEPRVGHLALAVGRSWSHAITASVGNVAVIGGPLPTGRGRSIARVIRTTAPMHAGFAGGAFVDVDGALLGIATAHEIRGLGVVIPASIALAAARDVLAHGSPKRGFLGLAGQAVRLTAAQAGAAGGAEEALLVMAVVPGSPAEAAGLGVGDLVLALDGAPVTSAAALLEALGGDRIGQTVTMRVLRGGTPADMAVTVGDRHPR